MALTPGTRIGSYEITARIGVGGMGEVYRATDTKLKRPVAIKVLPEGLAADSERLARLQREAEVLASLNHPNIAAIYGLEDTDGSKALVMELVEGPTLAHRIVRGAIPVDEALPIAKQIAEALEAAHEQGIIHRDLKPANIKLRPDGTVKVLDFGLAKAMDPASALNAPAGQAQTMSPTITTPAMTRAGLILGTAAYMSPEQARGKTADRRADIWAFGCVLYEMLSGRRAFGGDEVSDVLASVLAREPDLEAVPDEVPARIRDIVAACLQKDPRQRLHDIADVRLAMDGAFARGEKTGSSAYSKPAVAALWKRVVPWVLGITIGVAATVLIWGPSRPGEPGQRRLRRFAIHPTGRLSPNAGNLLGISPDATTLVYETFDGEQRRLYRHPMDQVSDTPLPVTQWPVAAGQAGGRSSLPTAPGSRSTTAECSSGSPLQEAPQERSRTRCPIVVGAGEPMTRLCWAEAGPVCCGCRRTEEAPQPLSRRMQARASFCIRRSFREVDSSCSRSRPILDLDISRSSRWKAGRGECS